MKAANKAANKAVKNAAKDAKEKSAARLSQAKILAAAMTMADDIGVEALSMRKLAVPLGVEAMALYRYFSSKRQLLDAMVAAVFAEIDWSPDLALSPIARQRQMQLYGELKNRCQALRQVLLRHPWCIRLMDTTLEPGESILQHHDYVLGLLRNGGCSRQQAADTYVLLDSFVFGFVLQELQLPLAEGGDIQDLAKGLLERLPADRYPHLRDMTEHHFLKADYAFAHSFDRGLDALLRFFIADQE